MKKIILFLVGALYCLSLVSAMNLITVQNPHTGRPDFIRSTNWSGENITADYFIGDGSLLTGIGAGAYPGDIFVNVSGDTMTGDLDMNGNRLSDVGELIMSGVITSQDIIPTTTELYSLGNATNIFLDIWAKRIHAGNITADYLNSDSVDSKDINISENLTVSGYEIREDSNWLTFKLK